MTNSLRLLLGATALVTSMGSIATAQTVFTGTDIAEDRNEDLREAIEDDAERDLDRFGNEGRQQGFNTSIAARATAQSGNTDTFDLGVGVDMTYLQGPNGYQLQLSYTYGEEDSTTTDESLFYGLEYTRDISPSFFGFAKIQGSVDEFSSFENDTFASIGAGYRIFDEPGLQWSVQAGPGYRFAEVADITSGDIDEVAFGIGSDYSNRISRGVIVTNDTDIIASDADTLVLNDLAISVAMSNNLALRTSLLTEYHTEPQPGFDDTDNTLGVSLVYSLN